METSTVTHQREISFDFAQDDRFNSIPPESIYVDILVTGFSDTHRDLKKSIASTTKNHGTSDVPWFSLL